MAKGMGEGTPAIRAEGLKKRFGRVHALDGIDLEAEQGTVLGLLGPNGPARRRPCASSRRCLSRTQARRR